MKILEFIFNDIRKVPASDNGFTLLELMLVIAIVGIFASISIPAFSDFIRDYRLRSFTNKVKLMMRKARFEAIAENRVIRIETVLGSSLQHGDDEINFEICTEKAEFNDDCPGIFLDAPDLDPLTPPEPVIIHAVCNNNSDPYSTSTGTHYLRFGPDGEATAHTNDKPTSDVCGTFVNPYIQLTYDPAPADSERCEFRTVSANTSNGLPKVFNYRREPFENVNDSPLKDLSCQ